MGFGGFLQANTAVDVLIGPFIDDTDGKTAETGLTLSQADIKLSKNGQALAQKNDDTAAAHDANGYYNCELDATDTNTEGTLTLIVHESGALPVRQDFMVLAQAAYISLLTAKDSGYMDINVKAVSEDTAAADNLELACDNYSATRGLSGTALPAAAADAAGGLPISDAGGLDLDTKLANTNEITVARMGALTDWINGGRLDLILDIIAADTTTDIPALIATLSGKVDTIDDFLDTEIAAILADTNELQTDWHDGGRLDLLLDGAASAGDPWTTALPGAYGAGTAGKIIGDNINAPIATVDTVVDAIKAKTDSLTFTVAGDVDCNVQTWKGSAAQDMTGDSFAIVNNVTYGNSALKTLIDAVDNFVDTEVAAIKTVVDGIEVHVHATDAHITADYGATEKAAIDLLDDVDGGIADIHTVVNGIETHVHSTETKIDTIDTNVDSVLADTGTDGVVVAAASKTGYTVSTVSDKTGYALSDAGVDAIFDRNSSLSLSFETLINRMYQILNNKMTMDDGAPYALTLRNIGDSGDIATATVTDDSTHTTRTELTWS